MLSGYITKSPARGVYSYRRRVPDHLRDLWGKREVKLSLKTKDYNVALRAAAKVNENFEAKAKHLDAKIANKPATPDQVWFTISEAAELLRREGLHPDQAPIPGVASQKEVEDFEAGIELFRDIHLDHKEVGVDPKTWDRIYAPYSETDVFDQAANILSGKVSKSISPTLKDAVDAYLIGNQRLKQRKEYDKRKFEQANRRATDRLAAYLGRDGYSTKLASIPKTQIRRFVGHLEASNPDWSPSTVNKDIQRLRAIFRFAADEFEVPLADVFKGMLIDLSKQRARDAIRSFIPAELEAYRVALNDRQEDVRLIAELMIATGARTNEIAGLTFGDLHLDSNIPHVTIQPNDLRQLKNSGSQREIPLCGVALDLLRDWVGTDWQDKPKDAPVFPRYGRQGGRDAISAVLNKVIRQKLKIADPKLVAYSTRHTFKDKLRACQIPLPIQYALTGHSHANRVAEDYGTGDPMAYLLDAVVRANQVADWGRF